VVRAGMGVAIREDIIKAPAGKAVRLRGKVAGSSSSPILNKAVGSKGVPDTVVDMEVATNKAHHKANEAGLEVALISSSSNLRWSINKHHHRNQVAADSALAALR